MTDVEQQLTDHLRRRAAAATPRYDLENIEHGTDDVVVSLVDVDDRRLRRRARPALVVAAAAAAAAAVIAIAAVTIPSHKSRVSTPLDRSTVPSTAPALGDSAAFDTTIAASGILTSPSAHDVTQAMDRDLYKDTGPAEVSAAGNYVSLLMCRIHSASTCGTGWAYVTGSAHRGDVHGGVLGAASPLDLQLVDDRYFVASESSPAAHAPSKAWLIDAVTGKVGALSSRDEPTTLNSPDQALGDEVVDARDGTIRPLAVPGDVVAGFPVAQSARRVWVRTGPQAGPFGLAYTDDGGATWTKVAFPKELRSGENGPEFKADGDRVAVISGGLSTGGAVYVSDDAGRSWTTATLPELAEGNRADMDVLADGRLVVRSYLDLSPQELLLSTGSDWAELKKVDGHVLGPHAQYGGIPNVAAPLRTTRFNVNSAGIAIAPSITDECATLCHRGEGGWVLKTIDFSTDLKHWSTIKLR